MPSYTSFCWKIGTTSFRTREFNKKIERQLVLLSNFWALSENENEHWSRNSLLQKRYYKYMKSRKFLVGDAPREHKDARQKTAGLDAVGLIDSERRLTQAGLALLNIVENQTYESTNQLRIDNDSFIYLKQLCKTEIAIDNGYVRPYLIGAYLLSVIGPLTNEEFTFLLPLITNAEKLQRIVAELQAVRAGIRDLDDIILDFLMEMPNYKEALNLLLANDVTEKLIMKIGMHRKSGEKGKKQYDKVYYTLYTSLKNLVFEQTDNNVAAFLEALDSLKAGPRKQWRKLLVKKVKKSMKNKLNAIEISSPIFSAKTESEFKVAFFRLMHLGKAKSTLSDYFDLNRRYFKTTDTMVFKNGIVDFDIVPKCFFALIVDKLLPIAFSDAANLYDDCDLDKIIPDSVVSDDDLFAQIESQYGVSVRNILDVKCFVEDERIARFNEMIDRNFPKKVLTDLLSKFERREDKAIQNTVTSNADIPTIFEYIVGIIWYNLSERKVNILNALNLSLDADLLPKSHASGGGEDITFKYDETPDYPEHALLLEVTLSNSINQRRMEMEPVSRHLGDYMLKNRNENAYCVFVSTFLHINVIGDFRARKNMPYYNSSGTDFVEGMKIIPCQTCELRTIIDKNITYSTLYKLFEMAYNSTDAPNVWYQKNIVKDLQ